MRRVTVISVIAYFTFLIFLVLLAYGEQIDPQEIRENWECSKCVPMGAVEHSILGPTYVMSCEFKCEESDVTYDMLITAGGESLYGYTDPKKGEVLGLAYHTGPIFWLWIYDFENENWLQLSPDPRGCV